MNETPAAAQAFHIDNCLLLLRRFENVQKLKSKINLLSAAAQTIIQKYFPSLLLLRQGYLKLYPLLIHYVL